MFTAIVTAMLGVIYLSWMGVLDLSLVYLVPTYWVPQVVGGLLLGVGFVVGGYCPGTSIASIATGRLDGLVFVLGIAAGTLDFARPSRSCGASTRPATWGRRRCRRSSTCPAASWSSRVVLMAVGGFAGATWVESKMASRTASPGAVQESAT